MNINAKFSDLHVLSYNKSALNNDSLRSIKAVGSLEFIFSIFISVGRQLRSFQKCVILKYKK